MSNRLGIEGYLAQVVAEPLRSPFESEIIVVQSKGMERWLTQELAQQAGIWANAQFPFPNTMAWDIFQRTLSDIGDDRLFTPEVMTWRILHLLQTCLDGPGFESVNNYLGSESNDLKSLQLCTRIADLFDQYTVYRPDMLLQWREGSDLAGPCGKRSLRNIRSIVQPSGRPFSCSSCGALESKTLSLAFPFLACPPASFCWNILALARFLQVPLLYESSQRYWETIVSPSELRIRSNQGPAQSWSL